MTGFFHIHLFIFGVCQAAPVAKCIFLGDGAGQKGQAKGAGAAEGQAGGWLADLYGRPLVGVSGLLLAICWLGLPLAL